MNDGSHLSLKENEHIPSLTALSWVVQKPEGICKAHSYFNPQDLFLKPASYLGEAQIAAVLRLQPVPMSQVGHFLASCIMLEL